MSPEYEGFRSDYVAGWAEGWNQWNFSPSRLMITPRTGNLSYSSGLLTRQVSAGPEIVCTNCAQFSGYPAYAWVDTYLYPGTELTFGWYENDSDPDNVSWRGYYISATSTGKYTLHYWGPSQSETILLHDYGSAQYATVGFQLTSTAKTLTASVSTNTSKYSVDFVFENPASQPNGKFGIGLHALGEAEPVAVIHAAEVIQKGMFGRPV